MHKFTAVIAAGLLAAFVRAGFAATLEADYNFQNSFASDVAGAPDIVEVTPGANSFITDTVNGQPRTVYQFGSNFGLSAQTNGLIAPDNYSVVIYAKLSALSVASPGNTNVAKLLDFKNLLDDTGLYNFGNQLDFYNVPTAVGPSVSGLFGTDQYAQLVLTRDAAAVGGPLVSAYVDGTLAFSFVDSGGVGYPADLAVIADPTPSANEFLHFFMNDNSGLLPTTLDPESQSGSVARIRLYDGALTAPEVATLDTVPEPASLSIMGVGALLLLRRRRSVDDRLREKL